MKELPRRLFHICWGLIIPAAGLLAPYDIFFITLVIITAIAIIIDLLRLKSEKLNTLFIRAVGPLLRPAEVRRFNGSTYLLIASTIAFFLFGKFIAATALIFLAIGDPFAGMVGTKWGRIKIKQKSLEGSTAFLITAFAASTLISSITHIPLLFIAVGALCAAIVELLSLSINDNLTIPLISGGVIWGLAYLFPC